MSPSVVDDAVRLNLGEAHLSEVHLKLHNGQTLDSCQVQMTRNDVDDDSRGDVTQCQAGLDQDISAETEEEGLEEEEEEEEEPSPQQGGPFIEVSQLVQLVSSESDIVHMDVVAGGGEEGVEGAGSEEMVQETALMGEVVDGTDTDGLTACGATQEEECLIVMAE